MQAGCFHGRGVRAPVKYDIVPGPVGQMKTPRKKTRGGIIFGGRSGEHEISLRSARCVVEAIDRDAYSGSLIGIGRTGHWHLFDEPAFRRLTEGGLRALNGTGSEVLLPPTPAMGQLIQAERSGAAVGHLDVAFPVLHGTFGEDGTIQGLLELADIPYVGAGVLGSAVGMDKDGQKRLLQAAGIAGAPFVTVNATRWAGERAAFETSIADLGLPLFVKPANLGSSVGITKVHAAEGLATAVATALEYDDKVLIEKGIAGREI